MRLEWYLLALGCDAMLRLSFWFLCRAIRYFTLFNGLVYHMFFQPSVHSHIEDINSYAILYSFVKLVSSVFLQPLINLHTLVPI